MEWLDRSRQLLSRLPIKDISTHRMVPFHFNPNQDKRFAMVREQWKRERKIRIIDLKSRRVGVSAQTDGLIFCFDLAFANMNSKIVAHLTGSAEELFRVPSDLAKAFPSFASDDIQMKRIFFPHKGGQSQMTLATAGTPAAGRGGTLSALHLCLAGDSLIHTNDADLVKISDIKIGELVTTHTGQLAVVTAISSRPIGDRKVVKINTWLNCESLTLTEDHKVWTDRGWIPAGEITDEDYIGTAIRSTTIRWADTPVNQRTEKRGKRVIAGAFPLDKETGFFLGYYLAEGWLGYNYYKGRRLPAQIGLAGHETEGKYAQRAVDAVRQFVTSHKSEKVEGTKTLRTTIHGSSLACLVLEWCGVKDTKRIPDMVFYGDEAFRKGIILGYLAGDGSKAVAEHGGYECPTIYVTSTRPRLLYQLRHLLASVGWGWGGITKEKGFTDKRGWWNSESWTLSISGLCALKIRQELELATTSDALNISERRSRASKYKLDGGCVWTKVRSVTPSECETVWDIEVSHEYHDDHSFETVIGAVANSEAAYYPSDDSFTSMISSVSKGEGSIVVIESTANGREGPGEAFFEYWTNAVEGRNGYIPCFLGWLQDPLCYRPEEEAEDAPADDLERELMRPPFNATREQIAWMRRTKADDCRDIETKWLTDYPHCPEVAFQVSGEPAFARDELAYSQTTVREPLCRGRFVRTGGTNFRFERRDDGPVHIWRFAFDKNGKSDGYRYYVGADSAAGTQTGDFAAYAVLCGQTGELAARFAERVDPEVFADQLDMVGRYYNMAMVNPELTGGLGRWTLLKLRDVFRYPFIYHWKGRDDRQRGKSKSVALGFEMNQATRRLIIDAARSGLRMGMHGDAGGLSVNDRVLMTQIDLCTLKEWRWTVERDHDDILVAWAIACLTREQYPPARMSFAPKNIMEEQSKQVQIGVKLAPSELDQIFMKEMKRIRIAAGLNQNMRGTGRKQFNRLVGI